MIQDIKIENLPDEMIKEIVMKFEKINCTPLRELSKQTRLSINTLRKIRNKREASIKVWRKLIKEL